MSATPSQPESTHTQDEIVDIGAIRCPVWFAEGLLVLIELEARDQSLKAGRDANKNAEEWLRKWTKS